MSGDGAAVRDAGPSDDVAGWLRRSWGEVTMAVHGQVYNASTLPALVVLTSRRIAGVLTCTLDPSGLEIVSCDTKPAGHGLGRTLVDAAIDRARHRGVARVWCTATNDNLPALGFWQALGFALVALRPGAVAVARLHKPSIPATGHRGLPIRDELDLELHLEPARG